MSTPPPKTPGFAKALFGLFSTAKKPRAVDSSTEATASVARSPHSRMQISLQSPSERDSSMRRNDSHTNYFGAAAPSTVDLLDNRALSSPPAAAAVATAAVSFATKSPWKQPSSTTTKLTSMNGKSLSHLPVQFSHGNLKPAPSNGGTQRSIGRTNRRRSRYRPSKVLIGAKRRHPVVNQANALSALEESRGIFQPSDRQLQARDNYTSMRPGKRLLGDTQRGGSRLVPASTNGAGSSSTTTSETHVMSSSEEQPTKRRKKVMFGQGVAASAPIESETVTPSRSITRRKETPFKPNQQQEDTDMMEPDSQMTMQSPSTARQSPARKLLEKTEVQLVLGRDDLSFIQPGEHEFLGPAVANLLPTLQDLDPLQTASSVSEIARGPAYFSPTTLAIGGRNKTTNKSTVVDHTADDPDKMTFTCKKCGTSNSNNLSTCNKCNEPRASQSKGWGNLWDAQKNKWKCETCSVPNEQDAYKCVSCDTLRPGHEDKAEKANAAIGSTSAAIGAGGFHFGGGASASSSSTGNFFAQAPVDALASTTRSGGFSFSGGSSSSAPSSGGFTSVGAQAASSDKETSASTGSTDGTKTPTFSFGSTLAAPSASAINSTTSENSKGPAAKPIGFSFASSPAPSTGGEPFKFTAGDPETKNSDDAPKPKPTPTFQFGSAPANSATVTTAISTEPASKRTRPTNGGMGSSSSSTSKTDAPSSSQAVFSFGNRSGGSASASGSVAGASGFDFAGTPATAPPVKGSLFEQPAGHKPPLPPSLGRLLGNDNDDRANRRRGRDDGDSNPLAQVPAATFGSAPAAAPPATTFGSNPPNQATPDPVTADLSFAGSTSSVFKFGQSPSNDNAAKPPVPTFGANSSAAPAALSFGGSTPVAPGPTTMSAPAPIFGGPSAAPPALPPTFGAPALAPPSSSAPLFGGPVDPQQAPTFQFGSAPVPGAASTFGSTPAPSAPTFGSAPAPVAPAFGSAPAPAFGSTPAPAAPTFGSTPAPTQGHFGSTPAPAAAYGSAAPAAQPFGSAPAPAPFGGGGGFGGPPPAAAPTSFGGGFGGAPAPVGFGGGGFGGPPPVAPPQQPGAFGGAPAGNFGGGFMAPPAAAPPVTGAPQFSIGSSGGNAGKTPGRRRILKARRPGSRQA